MFKKIFVIILLSVINIKIYALEEIKYTPYSEFSDWQEEKVDSSDLVEVEIEKRYRWYKEDRINGDYSIEGYNNPLFPLIDKANYYEILFSEYSLNKPEYKPNRIIESKDVYSYREMKPIRYIYIMRAGNYSGTLVIPELNIYVDNQKINYSYYCGRCSDNFSYFINNDNIYEDNVYFYNDQVEFRIDLNGYYDASKIRIELYLYNQSIANKNYQIILSPYFNLTEPQYFYKEFSEQFYCNNINEVMHFSYTIDSSWIKEPEWFDWKETTDIVNNSLTTEVKKETLYRYKDIMYRYYQINKIYYDNNYYLNAPEEGYISDNNDYKNYYKYRTRTVLEPIIDNSSNNNSNLNNNIVNESNNPIESPDESNSTDNNTVIPSVSHNNLPSNTTKIPISLTIPTIKENSYNSINNDIVKIPSLKDNKKSTTNLVEIGDIKPPKDSYLSGTNVNINMVRNVGYLLISIGLCIILVRQRNNKHNM